MTLLPPPMVDREAKTDPPEAARESSAPPADLGPTGLALRLLALEAKVDEIRAETFGISKAFHDIRNAVVGIRDSMESVERDVSVLRHDAQSQRKERAALRSDMGELERRVDDMVKEAP